MDKESAKIKKVKRAGVSLFASMTQAQVAEMTGAGSSLVSKWKMLGCPVNADGSMSAPDVIAWLRARDRADSKDKAAKARGKGDSLGRFRLERAKMARLERLEREGTLVPVEAARAILVEEITAAKAALLGIPRKLAARMAGASPRQAEEEMRDEIESAIRRLEARRDSLASKAKKGGATDDRQAPSRKRRPAGKRARRVARS